VDWHFDVIQRFVAGASGHIVLPSTSFHHHGSWEHDGHFSHQRHYDALGQRLMPLINDIMMRLGSVSCGRNGNTLLAPNALSQFGNILQVL
jgi:hypothetical protein